jgi:hypothetical protein
MTCTTTRYIVSIFIILLLGITSLTYAQSGTTSLRGTVTDSSGSVVPNAVVTLSNPEISATLTTHTDESGAYQFREVRSATYMLAHLKIFVVITTL